MPDVNGLCFSSILSSRVLAGVFPILSLASPTAETPGAEQLWTHPIPSVDLRRRFTAYCPPSLFLLLGSLDLRGQSCTQKTVAAVISSFEAIPQHAVHARCVMVPTIAHRLAAFQALSLSARKETSTSDPPHTCFARLHPVD